MKYKKFLCFTCAIFFFLNVLAEASFAISYISNDADKILLPIILYHEVKHNKSGKDSIQPWEFENDLKYLTENNYTTISMSDLINYVYYDVNLPEKPVILSFDDGYLNNYVYVFPLLKKYNMKIVFSVIGKDIDDFSAKPIGNIDYSHVTWDQLNEMIDSGCVEVQNHSYNLHSACGGRIGCRKMPMESDSEYEQLITDDVGRLQERIKLMTGKTPSTFVYPYGAWSKETDNILKKLGFKATVTCKYGINIITNNPDDLFHLKRICRAHYQNIGKIIDEGVHSGL
jgi:Predicted xylanase/chitin deacetylase